MIFEKTVNVDTSDAENPTKIRGSHKIKVKDPANTGKGTRENPGGNAFDMTEEPIISVGAGRKIVNPAAGDTHYKFVAARDIYPTRSRNCPGSAKIINLPIAEKVT